MVAVITPRLTERVGLAVIYRRQWLGSVYSSTHNHHPEERNLANVDRGYWCESIKGPHAEQRVSCIEHNSTKAKSEVSEREGLHTQSNIRQCQTGEAECESDDV
jgi:hypothetical protein